MNHRRGRALPRPLPDRQALLGEGVIPGGKGRGKGQTRVNTLHEEEYDPDPTYEELYEEEEYPGEGDPDPLN